MGLTSFGYAYLLWIEASVERSSTSRSKISDLRKLRFVLD